MQLEKYLNLLFHRKHMSVLTYNNVIYLLPEKYTYFKVFENMFILLLEHYNQAMKQRIFNNGFETMLKTTVKKIRLMFIYFF